MSEDRLERIENSLQNVLDAVRALDDRLTDFEKKVERGFAQTNLRLVAVETRLAAVEVRLSNGEARPEPPPPALT